jgi:hypothetical protein
MEFTAWRERYVSTLIFAGIVIRRKSTGSYKGTSRGISGYSREEPY